ncbi:uncharacterized protein FOKN1_1317 [Thiohalobacter thiocyanaticus]|uniref:Uncharacterized protein n=1 Tax=Thiohalobacter thiocyanaticus TaxID=585455 RepID=A0A1Z4VQE8_9GAMM|nr:uncharacterized protein FOKN1_1317 [Thiohalobacter thiocyanaticus]
MENDHNDHGHDHAATGDHADHAAHDAGAGGHGHGDSDIPAEVVTHFSQHTELFVEFPVLSVGNESPFAAHFTWLDDFRPVAGGRVSVLLHGGDLPEEEFTVKSPSIPGIFRPVVVPLYAAEREVTVILESPRQTSVHRLGTHTVYPDKADIPPQREEEPAGAISYLKEQQWQVDFATAPVVQRTLRESIRAVATVRAADDGEAELSAPHDGQLARRGGRFPTVGTQVRKGEVLAVVGSPLGRELQGLGRDVSGTALRSPIDGVIAQVLATEGSYLHKGRPVFHIIDTRRLWLEARIPENEILKLHGADGAWVPLPGRDSPLVIETAGDDANGRLVAFSQVIDSRTRTAPLILEFDNPGQQLHIGMLAQAHIYTGTKANSLAVPVSAVVRDSGVPVVYVELGGETFERRVVQLGIRDGDNVEVRSGLAPGERVVSRGAYLVKLAASSPAEAGHGHAH